jgi:23S rRNA-/tRNA-specific pseudouridylate synthase
MSSTGLKLSHKPTRGFWELEPLFEDADLLALDKPPDLCASPSQAPSPDHPSLMGLLHEGIRAGAPWARSRDLGYLALATRIEPESSGVVLLARSKPVLAKLADTLGSERPLKDCLTLVQGTPPTPEFEVDAPIGPHPRQPGLIHVDKQAGRKAHTRFRIEEAFAGFTLLRCTPLTHRLQQVRAHLRFVRLPVVGDPIGGGRPLLLSRLKPDYHLKPGREERPLLSIPTVHVVCFELPHPTTGHLITLTAPLPKDLAIALKYLRRWAVTSTA